MRYLILLILTTLPLIAQADDYGSATVQQVTSIYDGDTFRADLAGPNGEPWPDIIGHRAPIRVAGVDTPEIRAECDAEKQAARQAKQFTVAHLRDAERIRLEHLDRGANTSAWWPMS
ncbi:thermonuclease family protein [Kushneria phosphatilytica]|uniref:thermonuclease family protein n=1 Tax=Kushneria phosphatilytica TaxID=657387 RepID=UPI0019817903|nr:hypothetical protein [Kushneria phosphatilytica]